MNEMTKKISDVLDKYNKVQYFETNPAGHIIADLNNNGVKAATYSEIPHVAYGNTERIKIEVENCENPIILNLYRMDSGKYEVNAYDAGVKPKQERKSKFKP